MSDAAEKKPKVAREAAELEVDIWAETLGYTLSADEREKVIAALMQGRITFDSAKESFTYQLRSPLILDNGERVENLLIREPTAGEIRDAGKATKDTMEITIRLISYISKQPLGVIQRLGQRDVILIGILTGFFT